MAHVVTDLLVSVVAALTGLATTGARVYLERPEERELQSSELPALRVYDTADEAVDITLDPPPVQARNVQLTVEAVAKATSGLGGTLRQIALEVETALGSPILAGTKSVYVFYRGSDTTITDGDTDQPVGVRRMRFEALVHTTTTAPGTAL